MGSIKMHMIVFFRCAQERTFDVSELSYSYKCILQCTIVIFQNSKSGALVSKKEKRKSGALWL